jgi:hypothetical protein
MMAGGGMNTAQELAEMLRQMGRGRDTILAHITPEEAEMLLKMGGSGTINPKTGLPEFQQDDIYDMDIPGAGGTLAQQQADIQAGFYDPGVYSGYGEGSQGELRSFLPSDATYETALAQAQAAQRPDLSMRPGGQTFERPQPTGLGVIGQAEQKLGEAESFLQRNPRLTRLGATLAQALLARQAGKKLEGQAEQFRQQATPFRSAQEQAMSRVTGGGLTPQQARALERAQARAREGLAGRGATSGSAAAGILAQQEQRIRSTARQQSLQEALEYAGIADQYDQAAIQAELNKDRMMGQLLASILGGTVNQQQRTPRRG